MALRVIVDGTSSDDGPTGGNRGGPPSDTLQEARDVVLAIMRGKAGRGAMTRLLAAQLVLRGELLSALPDEDLLAEVKRRTAGKAAR